MATPLTVAIPPLLPTQRIEEWEPKFRASVSALEEPAAIRLLPAYINRGKLEDRVVLTAIRKTTLDASFKVLKESLDPSIDPFEAANRFRCMTWTSGELVYNFFARYLEVAVKAKLSVKFACVFMTTQLPKEVYQKAKEWLAEKPEDMGDGQGTQFAVKLREWFTEKGVSMDRGYRDPGPERVISVKTSNSESEGSDTEELTKDPAKVNTFRQSDRFHRKTSTDDDRVPRKTRPGQMSQNTGCFTCGKFGHGWRYCPERPCGNCGNKGHWTSKCRKASRRYDRNDKNFKREDAFPVNSNEEAVTLQVKMGTYNVTAMLDIGAKPCVIDRNTLAELKLESELVRAPSEVYGLCSSPVQVLGYVDTLIQVGNERPVTQRLRVLDSEERTLLLGRQFMEKFDTVTFDWKGGRIRLGNDWQPAQTMLSGSNALSRARIADEEVLELGEATKEKELINPKLLPSENQTISALLNEFTDLFAKDPKKPKRIKTEIQHYLDLEASTPIQVRPKRMPPAWEKTVADGSNTRTRRPMRELHRRYPYLLEDV